MDLPSDSDESDVDFVPDGELSNSDAESEAEAEREVDEQYEGEVARKNDKKRLAKQSNKKPRKKAKSNNEKDIKEPTENNVDTAKLKPEEVKKYEDDLWASFLGNPTQSSSKPIVVKETNTDVAVRDKNCENLKNGKDNVEPDMKEKIIDSVKEKTVEQSPATSALPARGKSSLPVSAASGPVGRKPVGGLASVLDRIGKKDKMSTLEKSKMDWMTFKKDEGLDEEIQTFNRGKSGYLERQDFLERSDLRQFEIEKNLRLNKRSSR